MWVQAPVDINVQCPAKNPSPKVADPPKVAAIQTFVSIQAGFKSALREPFIVRNARDLFHGLHRADLILDALCDKDVDVFGYDANMEEVTSRTGDVVKRFNDGSLKISLLDVEVSHLRDHLSAEMLQIFGSGMVTPILSPAGAFTALHYDPLEFGGGWMFLAQGEKSWVLVDPVHLPLLIDSTDKGNPNHTEKLLNLSLEEILERIPANAVRQGDLHAGDFLYFPVGWIHMVSTSEASVGIGGYH